MYRAAYRTVDVDGLLVFYREAGPRDAAATLLLHGGGRNRGTARGVHGRDRSRSNKTMEGKD